MPGQTTRGDIVSTWNEILGVGSALRVDRQAPFADVQTPPYSGLEWQTAAAQPREDGGPGRAELEIDRNHWKREALRYKQLLMDMLGKEVE